MTIQKLSAATLIVCSIFVGTSTGQQSRQSGTPGVWRNGFFIGYVPKHEKIMLQRAQQKDESPDENLAADSPVESEMQAVQASFEEALPVDELPGDFIADGESVVTSPPCQHAPGTCQQAAGGCTGFDIWGRAEYLQWWTKEMDLPPLVTTSPENTPQDQAGVLGQPGTSIRFGNGGLNGDSRSGGRFTLGWWLDPCRTYSLDVTYTVLDEESESFSASNENLSILARPFFNTPDGAQDSRLIVFPNLVEGTLAIATSTDFQTAEALLRRVAVNSGGGQIEYLAGYRYAQLEDSVRVEESTLSLSGPTAGSAIGLFDRFDTENEFHGGELGVRFLGQSNARWSLELLAKVALGNTRARAAVLGQTTSTTAAGDSTTAEGGLLALPTNIGTYQQDDFSTISEFGVTVRRQLDCGLSATIGYSFLYWSDVLRAGEQIDLEINTTQIPPGTLSGAARPAFPFETTDFWAQGLHLGLEYGF